MANHFGWQVTVVLDKKPFGQSREMMEAQSSATYFWPPEPLSYAAHTAATQFTGEMVNVSKVANFIEAFKLARAENEPDHILINTPDAVEAALNLNLHKKHPTTFYTHHENLVVPMNKASKVFGPSYNGFLYLIPQIPGMTVATQCDYNLVRMGHLSFAKPPIVLPMPIPDPQLMQPYSGKREGVLFIGRHEPRKDPKLFVKTVAEAGLPAKVLTNKRGVKKFEKLFADAGVSDPEIKCQITGEDKANFIKSAKVAFHPALSESYGFSAMETLAAGLPTLLIEEREWWQAFANDGVDLTSKQDATAALCSLYGTTQHTLQSPWAQHEANTFASWNTYMA
ncbi:glycosyltransferase [Ascidiaceihabitans sp.]